MVSTGMGSSGLTGEQSQQVSRPSGAPFARLDISAVGATCAQ
jgi:hypothetical protein